MIVVLLRLFKYTGFYLSIYLSIYLFMSVFLLRTCLLSNVFFFFLYSFVSEPFFYYSSLHFSSHFSLYNNSFYPRLFIDLNVNYFSRYTFLFPFYYYFILFYLSIYLSIYASFASLLSASFCAGRKFYNHPQGTFPVPLSNHLQTNEPD